MFCNTILNRVSTGEGRDVVRTEGSVVDQPRDFLLSDFKESGRPFPVSSVSEKGVNVRHREFP